ncbi:MAG: protein kinase [Chloroflexota bacterium]|nr:protein kinase [Chloroflexota bacterium]
MNTDGTTDPPLLLDRYRVEGILGTGGLGSVVSAFDTRLQRKVAIKTLKRSLGPVDPVRLRAIEDRFSREAIAGSRMGSHPNLVAVYDTVAGPDETLYLILEYVPGGTLDHRLSAAGTLPLAAALRVTADTARGLLAAHEAGLVHRDIKPANIFLAADGRAQVGDFGIAQIDDVSGRTQAIASHPGTPLYMSPEQESMTGYLRPNTDQYALGLVLFEMLTGKIYKRLGKREATALLATQPPPVAALIERLVAENPDDRYPDMARVMSAVQAITTAMDTGAVLGASSYQSEQESGATQTVLDASPPGVPFVPDGRQAPPLSFGSPPSFAPQPSPLPFASQPPYPIAPSSPRRMGRRNALFAIGGIVAAGAAGGGYLLLGRGASDTATATPALPAVAGSPTGVSTAALTPVTANVAAGTPVTSNTAIATALIATPTATPRPTVTPGPTNTPVVAKFSTRAITDAMSHPEQWQMDKIPNQSTRTLDNGAYTVRVSKKPDGSGLFSWGNWVPPEGVAGAEFSAEVEMRLQGDAAGAAGGFVFLYNYASNVNDYQYLTFTIRGDRKFSVAQQLPGGEGHDQKLIDLAQQAAINPGTNVTNLMRIEVRQGKFSCYANNQPIYLDQVVPYEVKGFTALAFAANVTKSSVESDATATFSNFRYENLSR